MPDQPNGFFQDSDGNRSWGRAGATFCLLMAAGCAITALSISTATTATVAVSLTGSFLMTAGALYGTSKGQQMFTDIGTQLVQLLGKFKLGGSRANTPEQSEEK